MSDKTPEELLDAIRKARVALTTAEMDAREASRIQNRCSVELSNLRSAFTKAVASDLDSGALQHLGLPKLGEPVSR